MNSVSELKIIQSSYYLYHVFPVLQDVRVSAVVLEQIACFSQGVLLVVGALRAKISVEVLSFVDWRYQLFVDLHHKKISSVWKTDFLAGIFLIGSGFLSFVACAAESRKKISKGVYRAVSGGAFGMSAACSLACLYQSISLFQSALVLFVRGGEKTNFYLFAAFLALLRSFSYFLADLIFLLGFSQTCFVIFGGLGNVLAVLLWCYETLFF